jgi:hypothetical protein
MTKTKGKTVKVVINKCFGGFSISKAAADYMAKKGSKRAAAEVAEYDKKNRWMKSYLKTGKWPKAVPEFERGMLEIDAKYHQKPRFHGYGYAEGMDGAYERDDPLLVEAVEKLGDDPGWREVAHRRIRWPRAHRRGSPNVELRAISLKNTQSLETT